jgi:cell division protein FtsI (penicillin-binding protein 3)
MTTSNRRNTSSSIKDRDNKQIKTNKRKKKSSSYTIRLLLIWGLLFLSGLGLLTKLYTLQVVDYNKYKKKTEEQQLTKLRPYIPRREIVDTQNNILATDRLTYTLYAHPIGFSQSKEKIAADLAKILTNKSYEQLLARFNSQNSGIKIATNLSESIQKQIRQLKYGGLDIEQEYSRFYPYQDMYAEIVGYLDAERKPQAGVELSQEDLLARLLQTYKLKRTGKGAFMPGDLPNAPIKPDELKLQLTIDGRVQESSRLALKQVMTKYKAKRGAVIVMDVRDGSLVALVSEPTYDPNNFSKYSIELFKNWTISDLYEPGSTFKPINVAIALEAGVIKPNDSFDDPGKIVVDKMTIYNHDFRTKGANGNISITQILERSSNIGMIKIMSLMQRRDFYKKLKLLGINEKMSIDLLGFAPGQLRNEYQFTNNYIDPATAAFGQGFSLTPIKLVQLQGALANGGKLVTPHIVKGLVDSQGHLHWQKKLSNKQVFPEKVTLPVLEMMESVVAQGSGKPSQVPGYRIAGKTGTAQKVGSGKGYEAGAKITSFVGIFPVESPRYVVLTVVDEPKGANTFGSTVAAPVVKSVIESLIVTQGIQPFR